NLYGVGFLPEVAGWGECGHAFIEFTGAQQEHDASVFFTHEDIGVAVAIPVEDNDLQHLEIEVQGVTVVLNESLFSVGRLGAGTYVFKVGETVKKFTGDNIEVTI